MSNDHFTHLDAEGNARMVDVSQKNVTYRTAKAHAEIVLQSTTIELIKKDKIKKGNVVNVAEIAGILAAKQTSQLIPLCHPIILNKVEVRIQINEEQNCLEIFALVSANDKTGVEMEALTAVSIAALTVYDMVKAVDRSAVIQNIYLQEKHGGKSGDFYQEKI